MLHQTLSWIRLERRLKVQTLATFRSQVNRNAKNVTFSSNSTNKHTIFNNLELEPTTGTLKGVDSLNRAMNPGTFQRGTWKFVKFGMLEPYCIWDSDPALECRNLQSLEDLNLESMKLGTLSCWNLATSTGTLEARNLGTLTQISVTFIGLHQRQQRKHARERCADADDRVTPSA